MERKYERAPTIKEIDHIIKMSGLRASEFERFYGIPQDTITPVRRKKKKLPEKYWHFFFDPPKAIREKIDAIDEFRHRKNKHKNFVSRFEKAGKKRIRRKRSQVKKFGVLADLLT